MTKTQKSILALLSLTACGLLSVIAVFGYQVYQDVWTAPLGSPIAMSTSTWSLPPTWTLTPSILTPTPTRLAQGGTITPSPGLLTSSLATTQAPLSPTPALLEEALLPTNTPLPMMVSAQCNGPETMTILAVGSDARGNTYLYGLADVIRIARVDFVNVKVTILEFPRDLWVEIPDISDNLGGQDHEKLNQAYLYGNPGYGYYEGPGAGPGLLARTLALNFGLAPDRYVGVNMRTFEKIVDAVGGIDVYLPDGMDGRTAEDRSARLVFPAGNQTLSGAQALTLARIRNEGVFKRAENQNLVLCALQEKLISPMVVMRIPALIQSFQGAVQTDLTPEQITQLACLGTKLRAKDITFVSFPRELFTGTRVYDPVFKARVFVWDVDFLLLRDYVARFNLGTWPAPVAEGESPPDEDAASTCP
ncbi:MAG: LCP family protein [Chloroflexota bacterium]